MTSLDEKLREIAFRHCTELIPLQEAAALGAREQREADKKAYQYLVKLAADAAVIGPLVTDEPFDVPSPLDPAPGKEGGD